MAKLLYAILFTLIFTGIRVTYSVITTFTQIQDLARLPIGLRVGLSFILELISVLSFVVVGVMTRNVRLMAKEEEVVMLNTQFHTLRTPRTDRAVRD
jgi:hypothetical protein